MVDEMASFHKNEAWDLVELSAGRKPIASKWVFMKKTNAEGKVEKYKARLVAKEQMDVKKTFLHGDLEEEIYMKQHEGFVVKGKKELVEYMVATHASKEAVWLQILCSSMGLVQGAIRIDCDRQSEIFWAKKPAYHSKTKHINVWYHFVMDMTENKKVLLVKVDTLKNTADALTKSVSSEKFS
eukprot:PITA_36472